MSDNQDVIKNADKKELNSDNVENDGEEIEEVTQQGEKTVVSNDEHAEEIIEEQQAEGAEEVDVTDIEEEQQADDAEEVEVTDIEEEQKSEEAITDEAEEIDIKADSSAQVTLEVEEITEQQLEDTEETEQLEDELTEQEDEVEELADQPIVQVSSVAEELTEEQQVDKQSDIDVNQTESIIPEVDIYAAKPWLNHYDTEIPHSIEYPEVNIAQFLIDTAAKYPTNDAVEFMGYTLNYEQLYLKADQLAKYLGSIGVKKGDRVAIMLPNTPQAVIAYYGVLLAGAVVVQTNPLYVERELKYQLIDSGAVVLITIDLLINRVKKVRGENNDYNELSFLKKVIITSIADSLNFPKNVLYKLSQRKNIPPTPDSSYGYVSWKSIFKQSIAFERPNLEIGNSLAAIQYTGGTTGTPKGVMLSHANLVANTLQTSAWCYKSKVGQEKYLAALPLFHVFGLTVLMNYSVSQAGQLILLPKFEVNQVLKTIEKKKPSIFPGAPTMYIAVLQAAAKVTKKLDLSSINICISGSAALPLEVQQQFEDYTGGRLVEGYGLSEAAPVTHANPIWGKRKIGTIGLPFPNTDAAIINPQTGQFLVANEIGELVIKGPQVMQGYWNRPQATEQTFINGWLRTGDMGKMDEEGYFSIVDRIKDIIIASGFNIYPREIEEVLYEHPAIAEAAAIGVKDEYRGETVKAFIVLKSGATVTEQELDTYCRSKLANFKVPQYYEFRESLPKTMVGKILKRQLYEK